MERATRVSVFESENTFEIQKIKSRLDAQNMDSFLSEKEKSFNTKAHGKTIRVLVNIKDEKNAFEIIDAYLREINLHFDQNTQN